MTLGARTSRARTVWYLDARSDGTVDVSKKGRQVASGMSAAEARKYLRRHFRKGDRAYQVEPDGYRTPL